VEEAAGWWLQTEGRRREKKKWREGAQKSETGKASTTVLSVPAGSRRRRHSLMGFSPSDGPQALYFGRLHKQRSGLLLASVRLGHREKGK
jgi:hypothetical protein